MVIFKRMENNKSGEENILFYCILCEGSRMFSLAPGKCTKSNRVN